MDIRTEQLTKRYGGQIAVDGISFQARPGEVLGFLGPNGAGKTTTMRMICGLAAPDGGAVLIGGRRMVADAADLRRAIGYLPEANPLYEDMPVLDLLRFGARLQGVARGNVDRRIGQMVEACGLEAEKHKRTGELSRGYRQRAGLAFALVHDPAVLVLDEPTTGLDPNQVLDIRKLIKELGRTKTVIFSTHILPEAEAVCDRILIMHKGRIMADGTAQDLQARQHAGVRYMVRVPAAAPQAVLAALRAVDGVTDARAEPGAGGKYQVLMSAPNGERIAAAIAAHGWPITELRTEEARLEDIFREATHH